MFERMFGTAVLAPEFQTPALLAAVGSVDQLEQELFATEALVARARARQLALIRALDAAQVPLADGCRTMGEWVSSRMDVAPETARDLVRTARTCDRGLEEELAEGFVTFDRVVATGRLAATDAPDETVEASKGLDIAGVRRLASRWTRYSRADEVAAFEGRRVVIQPNLDESVWQGWFRLPGVEGRLLDQALTHRAEQLPDDSDSTTGQRRADALTSMALDALDGDLPETSGGSGRVPLISVFVDADIMAATDNQAGISLDMGLGAGPNTLQELLCTGMVETNQRTPSGQTLGIGRKSHAIPPRLRRAVLHRDGGCVADGCDSRYRLQPHHVIPWSRGGETEPDNLATLCWFHHHVVVHGRGQDIDPQSPPGRVRFLRRDLRGPPDL
jgi:hypothetical protein